MVVGIMNTEHFEFIVFADSTSQAEELMNKAFTEHLKDCNTEWTEDCSPIDWYGLNTHPVVNHTALRDGLRMKGF